MSQSKVFTMLAFIVAITACANKPAISGNYLTTQPYLPVTLSIQGDNSGTLREFPLTENHAHYRAYVQAVFNERYRLHVTNNTNQRIGLVIAVDGRNIISGKKSWLGNNERMYILDPHDSSDYEGWRTSSNQVNRFYFTDAGNSYAAAWGDTSAMGVIAMAVYAEQPQVRIYDEADKMTGAAEESVVRQSPGTGFGETTYSPSVTVNFEPQSTAMEKVFLKYEWKETLCKKGILPECSTDSTPSENRFWPNDNEGFAPPPPR